MNADGRPDGGQPPRAVRWILAAFVLFSAGVASGAAGAERIVAARYADPVDRYGHYALGRPHEYARLEATTSSGRRLALELPQHEVFEDLAPRLVRLAPDAPPELLLIVSAHGSGARLALAGLAGERLEITAQSPPIGTPMRWLNPVGVADLDGDGHAEIAAVITPHIGGTLKVYRRQGPALAEIAALRGFSNHTYGSPQLDLSLPIRVDGAMRLLVPDVGRTALRVVALRGGALVETARCALPAPIVGPLQQLSETEVSAQLDATRARIAFANCAAAGQG